MSRPAYVPDDEAWEIADSWARQHSAPAGTRGVNFSYRTMKEMTREAADPFGLDELVDGVWRDEDEPAMSGMGGTTWTGPGSGPDVFIIWNGRGGIIWSNEPPVIIDDELVVSDPIIPLPPLRDPPAAAVDLATNRKRHGFTAVCPRHGETKGGMCRRCSR